MTLRNPKLLYHIYVSLLRKKKKILVSPHPLVILRSGEDLRLSNEDITEGPTATALLVETGDWAHSEGLYHHGLGVGQSWLL